MRQITVFLTFLFMAISSGHILADSIKARFKDKEKLTYNVSFNGIPSGIIEWKYLGRREIDQKDADLLSIESDTKILELLSLSSKEKVFLDSKTHLPLRVERDIIFFGNKELIQEIYNQDKGIVRIVRNNSQTKQDILKPDKPIHHILALLYFFPEDISFKKGKWMVFNLPTQKLKIKMVQEKVLVHQKKKKDTYFLIGRGARRFNLWLDKRTRLPLRLEFILYLGKIIITRSE